MTATRSCPTCRQTMNSDALFCGNCGLSTAQIFAETERMEVRETHGKKKPDPVLGQVLDSKYEIIERLGDGAMGAVYRARRLHIGDEVAIKVLHQEYVSEGRAIERFRREARSAAVISHANVVTIHDFGESRAEGAPAYLVMELVRGPSLRELLKREGRFNPARAVALLRDICAGVGAAHRRGVVHRDLKPDNVIVVPPAVEGDHEVAKVVDFGLAKLRDMAAEFQLTQTGVVMGTPYYMSPEQCRGGEQLDARADVYSLGAMLYEMLSGSPPFQSDSFAGLITKHLYEAPPHLPADLQIPPALEAVCRRAMAKNPEERQADATALSRELQTALVSSDANTVRYAQLPSGQAAAAPSDQSRLTNASGAKRSHWLAFTAAGLFVLLLGAVAVVGIALYINRGGATDRTASTQNVNSVEDRTPSQTPVAEEGAGTQPTNANSQETAPAETQARLAGTWSGTYGPTNQPTRLTIKEGHGNEFTGVLEQGTVRVAFVGTVDKQRVTFKETKVLSGYGWSLGENSGEISNGGRKMSGTGKDPFGGQFGMTYDWSFARQ